MVFLRAGVLLWRSGGLVEWLGLPTGGLLFVCSLYFPPCLCFQPTIDRRSTPRRLGKVYCSNRPGVIFFLKDGVWTEMAGGEG